MKILKDGFRADMERIKRELTVLQGVSIHAVSYTHLTLPTILRV